MVLAIGFFDGFHRGHQAIVKQLLRLRRPGFRAGVLTFRDHPAAFLRANAPALITTCEERLNLLAQAGIEECFCVPFDDRVASMSPRSFIHEVLLQGLRVNAVVVGQTFRFGRERAGDVSFAREELERSGVAFVAVENTMDRAQRISSTRIREYLASGDLVTADELLGHAYALRGRVVFGAGRGHDMGFPTANLVVAGGKALPKDGVYAALARHDGRDYATLVSVGSNPTFGVGERTVEAWLRDFDRSIYGEELLLHQFRFVRDQQRFDSPQGLIEQMKSDKSAVAYPSYG